LTAAPHPPLAPGWIDRPHQRLALGDFALESGEVIRDFELSYVVHGRLDETRSNAVLALSAIGSTHHRLDFLIGPGRALDPARRCIIAVDAIGNGLTTSPSNSRAQPGRAFPRFAIRDMVESQRRLVQDHLHIERLRAVVGASMGGMQALQWGVSCPAAMEAIVALVPMARTTPWSRLVNEASRRILEADPGFPGAVSDGTWRLWALLMQGLAGRTPAAFAALDGPALDGWVREREDAWLGQGFHPLDWVYQTYAYDTHDVGTTAGFGGDTARALAAIRARCLVMAPPLDLYNPAEAARAAAAQIPGARFVEIRSVLGHQAASGATAEERAILDREIGRFLTTEGA
jgi:homoserine O-acetyltransferase